MSVTLAAIIILVLFTAPPNILTVIGLIYFAFTMPMVTLAVFAGLFVMGLIYLVIE